jgi:hypothetical protein
MASDLYEMASELQKSAQYDGSELREWWEVLASLVPRVFDCASEEFRLAFEKELRSEYKRLKEEFRLVTTTETQTITYYELQHESEWE